MGSDRKQIKVTLAGSVHGQLANIRSSVRGLGLRKIRDSRVVEDTPENRGMIRAARHLLVVEQA